MFTQTVSPRFCETDALGHINNTVLPMWFEVARTPIFKLFTPDLNINNWQLVIAKIEVEFLAELFYGEDVELKTYLSNIGRSSMSVVQEAWQNGKCCAKGKAALIHFDHQEKKSQAIPDKIKELLKSHLIS